MGKPGSSPRVRGKPHSGCLRYPKQGLIPACAGKTIRTQTTWCFPSAHPRVCGENIPEGTPLDCVQGSSPRVRGKLGGGCAGITVSGLIPACAGKTAVGKPHKPNPRAHPRVCGENSTTTQRTCPTAGSSPRVRGKHQWRWGELKPTGLIPACAGKTLNDLEF